MGLLARTVVGIPVVAILVVVAWIGPIMVDPIAAQVFAAPEVADLGWGMPAKLAIRVVLRWFPSLIAGIVLLWIMFGSIREDVHRTRY